MKQIQKCDCGSTVFDVLESYAYKMKLIDGELLNTSSADGGVDTISCEVCSKHYRETDFSDINFD